MNPLEKTQVDGLRFFGLISASISHEIKNVLAIISESAGLMEDLLLLAQKGGRLDLEKFQAVCQKVRRQTQRADEIIRNMNRFSHSVDQDVQRIDLNELVFLVKALSDRLAAMREISLEEIRAGDAVWVTTNPFLLARQVWSCIDFAMSVATPEKKVKLLVTDEPSHGCVVLRGLRHEDVSDRLAALVTSEASQMNLLGATLLAEADQGGIRLLIPKDLPHDGTGGKRR
jgi:light-regulated signal transduction histidine kinase (bacteriophytochrome)